MAIIESVKEMNAQLKSSVEETAKEKGVKKANKEKKRSEDIKTRSTQKKRKKDGSVASDEGDWDDGGTTNSESSIDAGAAPPDKPPAKKPPKAQKEKAAKCVAKKKTVEPTKKKADATGTTLKGTERRSEKRVEETKTTKERSSKKSVNKKSVNRKSVKKDKDEKPSENEEEGVTAELAALTAQNRRDEEEVVGKVLTEEEPGVEIDEILEVHDLDWEHETPHFWNMDVTWRDVGFATERIGGVLHDATELALRMVWDKYRNNDSVRNGINVVAREKTSLKTIVIPRWSGLDNHAKKRGWDREVGVGVG
jgi:hypothetical protein